MSGQFGAGFLAVMELLRNMISCEPHTIAYRSTGSVPLPCRRGSSQSDKKGLIFPGGEVVCPDDKNVWLSLLSRKQEELLTEHIAGTPAQLWSSVQVEAQPRLPAASDSWGWGDGNQPCDNFPPAETRPHCPPGEAGQQEQSQGETPPSLSTPSCLLSGEPGLGAGQSCHPAGRCGEGDQAGQHEGEVGLRCVLQVTSSSSSPPS